MRKNRGPVDSYSVDCGHGGMKRNRHDPFSPIDPIGSVLPGVAALNRQADENIQSAGKMVEKAKAMPALGPTKERAKAMNKAQRQERMKNVGKTAATAAADMAGQMAADEQRFDAEHQQAVSEGRAMQAEMMRSTPGKAEAIIKNRKV